MSFSCIEVTEIALKENGIPLKFSIHFVECVLWWLLCIKRLEVLSAGFISIHG